MTDIDLIDKLGQKCLIRIKSTGPGEQRSPGVYLCGEWWCVYPGWIKVGAGDLLVGAVDKKTGLAAPHDYAYGIALNGLAAGAKEGDGLLAYSWGNGEGKGHLQPGEITWRKV